MQTIDNQWEYDDASVSSLTHYWSNKLGAIDKASLLAYANPNIVKHEVDYINRLNIGQIEKMKF